MKQAQPWNEKKARRGAWIALSSVLVITSIFFGAILTNFQLDYDFEKFFPINDEATDTYQNFRKRFGTDNDFVLIGLVNEEGVFKKDFLEDVDDLVSRLRELPHIDTVVSPLELQRVEQRAGSLSAEFDYYPMLDISDPSGYAEDSAALLGDERYANNFFSTKRPAIAIFIKTENYLSKKGCDELGEAIPKLLDEYSFDDVHFAGRSVGQSYFIALMERDLLFFIGSSVVLLIVFLIIAFRAVWGVLVPLTVVMLANIWILGLMSLIGEPVNMVLTMLPTIVFVVGMSDVVHIVSKYLEELRLGKPKLEAVQIAFREIGLATLLTSVTTAIGFLTLLASNVMPIRIFGLYTAIAVMLAYILAFTILPSLLILLKKPRIATARRDLWKGMLRRCFLWTIRHPRLIMVVSIAVIASSVLLTTRVRQDNYILEDLKEGNVMREHFGFFDKSFAGVRPVEVEVTVVDPTRNILDYEVATEINKLEDYLKHQYGAGNLVSLNTIIKSMHQTNWMGDPEKYVFPDERRYKPIKRALRINFKKWKRALTDSSKMKPEYSEFSTYVDTSLRVTRITGRVGDWGSMQMRFLNHALYAYAKDNIDSELISFKLTGTAHLLDRNNRALARNMLRGLVIAFALVALIMGLLFRSVKMMVISLLPNVVPLLLIGGLLGAAGTELKVSVSIIFTVAFGICVDDTIHFMSKIKLERMKGRTMIYALKRAYLSTGRAIIITSLILCSGFLFLIFSEFMGTFYVGYLLSVTLFVAVIADLFLLPALLLLLTRKEKKGD